MLNIHELERRWFRYKIRSSLPLVIAGAVTAVALGLIIIFQPSLSSLKIPPAPVEALKPAAEAPSAKPETSSADAAEAKEQLPPPAVAVQTEEQPAPKSSSPAASDAKPAVMLAPSMQFLNNIEEDITLVYEEESAAKGSSTPPPAAPAPSAKPAAPAVKSAPAVKTAAPVAAPAAPTEEKASITIIAREDADDLKDVINRFKKNKNPALSLFVARRYYDLQQYQKAYNYALITNEINNDIEDSWLIFAKSLVKLGQKEKAISTLKSHLKQSDSPKARMLLEDIIQGRFK